MCGGLGTIAQSFPLGRGLGTIAQSFPLGESSGGLGTSKQLLTIEEKVLLGQLECGTDDIKMSNRNKKVNCSVCHNMLRADTLKRHMKTHKDLLSLPEGELEEELRS